MTRHRLALAAVFAVGAALLLYGIGEPWIGYFEGWNGALFSTAARNHLEHGLGVTHLAVMLNGDPTVPNPPIYYFNHPPFLPLAVAGAFAVFGEHEWAARLVSIGFSLGSLWLVYRIGARLTDRRLGLFAAAIYALMPMAAFFGRMVNHEAPTAFFALAAAWWYLEWEERRTGGALAWSLGCLAVGAGFGWPAYYLAGLLPAFHLLTVPRERQDRRVYIYPAVAVALFALYVGFVLFVAGGDAAASLADAFRHRVGLGATTDFGGTGTGGGQSLMSIDAPSTEQFTAGGFVWRWAERAATLFTWPVLLLAAIPLFDLARRRRDAEPGTAFMTLLLVFGFAHMALFLQGAWIHSYWAYYCAAPLALLAARGLRSLEQPAGRLPVAAPALVTVAAAALPGVIAIHRIQHRSVLRTSALVAETTRPSELVLSNAARLRPQVRYYARRHTELEMVVTPKLIEDALAVRGTRRLAFLLEPDLPGGNALRLRLDAWAPPDTVQWDGVRYFVYHIPAQR